MVLVLVGEGFHLGHIHLTLDVDGLGFLGKYQGHAKLSGNRVGDGNAGCLNGQHLGNVMALKSAVELSADLIHQSNIHLVVQEAVHLQHITGLDNTVFHNPLFQEIHICVLLTMQFFGIYRHILPYLGEKVNGRKKKT